MATLLEMYDDRLLILPDPIEVEEKTEGGILLPNPVSEQPLRGTVVSVGPGIIRECGFVPTITKVGDRVMFGKYGYDRIALDGRELFIVKESDVKGRLHEDSEAEYEVLQEASA